MGRVCYTMGERRNEYRISVEKEEVWRSLGRSRFRWMGNNTTKMDLGVI